MQYIRVQPIDVAILHIHVHVSTIIPITIAFLFAQHMPCVNIYYGLHSYSCTHISVHTATAIVRNKSACLSRLKSWLYFVRVNDIQCRRNRKVTTAVCQTDTWGKQLQLWAGKPATPETRCLLFQKLPPSGFSLGCTLCPTGSWWRPWPQTRHQDLPDGTGTGCRDRRNIAGRVWGLAMPCDLQVTIVV